MAFGKHTLDWSSTFAAIWRPSTQMLKPVHEVDFVNLDEILGVDDQKEELCLNTENFLNGKLSNHALLWGTPGTGKSSLIKGILTKYRTYKLRVIEVAKEDIGALTEITDELRDSHFKFIIYCDGLSFRENDAEYRGLKNTLEGSIEKPPANVKVYATSNTRTVPTARKNSSGDEDCLADHFGVSLAFEPMSEEVYLQVVDNMFSMYRGDREELHHAALEFAKRKPYFNGRTAEQFYNYYSHRS